jgi:simple sugar transport system ATP-binding protein
VLRDRKQVAEIPTEDLSVPAIMQAIAMWGSNDSI